MADDWKKTARLRYKSDEETIEKEADENQYFLTDEEQAQVAAESGDKGKSKGQQKEETIPRLRYKSDEPPGPSVVKERTGAPLFDTEGYLGFVEGVYANNSKLRNASLRNFDSSKFRSMQMDEWNGMDARDADLQDSKFENINLSGSQFNRANLAGVSFKGSDLTACSFLGCRPEDFEGCDFSNCDLSGCQISRECLEKAITTGAKLSAVSYPEDSGQYAKII